MKPITNFIGVASLALALSPAHAGSKVNNPHSECPGRVVTIGLRADVAQRVEQTFLACKEDSVIVATAHPKIIYSFGSKKFFEVPKYNTEGNIGSHLLGDSYETAVANLALDEGKVNGQLDNLIAKRMKNK